MKVIKKTWHMFCFLAMTLIIVGMISGTAPVKAQTSDETDIIKNSQINSKHTDSPLLYTLKKASDDSEVEVAEYETNILQSDSHILTLKNTTKDMDISFKSSDTSILSVKKKGDCSCIYTGEAYGTAEIIITVRSDTFFLNLFDPGTTLKKKVSVTPHATSIKSVKQKISLIEGKKANFELTIRPSTSDEVPVFLSKNPKVATVNAKGKIIARSVGSTFVTATIENGKTTQCLVTVKKQPPKTD